MDYDLKHGVTIDEVIQVLQKIKNDETFAPVMQSENAILRFNEIEKSGTLIKESWNRIIYCFTIIIPRCCVSFQ